MSKPREFIAYKRVKSSKWLYDEYSEANDKAIDAIAPEAGNYCKIRLREVIPASASLSKKEEKMSQDERKPRKGQLTFSGDYWWTRDIKEVSDIGDTLEFTEVLPHPVSADREAEMLRAMEAARVKYGNGGLAEDFDEGFKNGWADATRPASQEGALRKLLEEQEKVYNADVNLFAEQRKELERENERITNLASILQDQIELIKDGAELRSSQAPSPATVKMRDALIRMQGVLRSEYSGLTYDANFYFIDDALQAYRAEQKAKLAKDGGS